MKYNENLQIKYKMQATKYYSIVYYNIKTATEKNGIHLTISVVLSSILSPR